MLRVCAILGFGALCASDVIGQNTFNIVYNYTIAQGWPDAGGGAGVSVWPSDSGYLVFSNQVATGGYTKIFTHRFNSSGQALGDIELFGPIPQNYNYGYAAPVDVHADFALSGIAEFDISNDSTNRLLIARYAPNGDTLSTHIVFDSCFCGPLQSRSAWGGRLLMPGFIAYGGALFMADTSGQLVWQRTYPDTRLALAVEPLEDSSIVMAGSRASGIDNGVWVMRLDSAGNTIWRRDLGGSRFAYKNVSALQTQDGSIVATCSYMPLPGGPNDPQWNYFRKWDINGNVQWSKQYNEQPETTTYDLEELGTGDLVACGAESSTPIANHGLLMKLQPDGDLLWLRRYTYYNNTSAIHTPYDVETTSDGGFVMAGRAIQGSSDSLPGLSMVWLLKVDSMGCLVPGCGNIGVEEIALGLENALRVYPNPTHGAMQVELNLPDDLHVQGALQLVVVDALGRQVLAEAVDRTASTVRLDLSGTPAGMYYFHLRDDVRWLSGTQLVLE
ncbi:MAG: T9SS type A sorting domain-containing protein [Flavobacteriales bacterium]